MNTDWFHQRERPAIQEEGMFFPYCMHLVPQQAINIPVTGNIVNSDNWLIQIILWNGHAWELMNEYQVWKKVISYFSVYFNA